MEGEFRGTPKVNLGFQTKISLMAALLFGGDDTATPEAAVNVALAIDEIAQEKVSKVKETSRLQRTPLASRRHI